MTTNPAAFEMMDSENVRDMCDKNNPGMFQQKSQVQTTRRILERKCSKTRAEAGMPIVHPPPTQIHPLRFALFAMDAQPTSQAFRKSLPHLLLLSPPFSPKRLLHPLSSAITHTTYHGSSTTGAHSPFFSVPLLTRTLLIKCPSRRTVLLSRHGNSNPTNTAGR